MEVFLETFNLNNKDKLDFSDFKLLCKTLFQNADGEPYQIEERYLKEIFDVFDTGGDGFIAGTEFALCRNSWLNPILQPTSAFVIVDVQNDFISGSLSIRNCPAKQDGAEIVPPINRLLASVKFDAVFYSFDWHPENHISFIDNVNLQPLHRTSPVLANVRAFDTVIFDGNPPVRQKLWPRHCMQGTWGAELHPDLRIVDGAGKIYKGTDPEIDSYSAIFDNNKMGETGLRRLLEEKNITDVYVCGLAYDVCVGATALDALRLGYRTILVEDCTGGLDLGDIEKMRGKIMAEHGVVVNSDRVKAMVEGKDRRYELGYKLALELKAKSSK